MPEQNSQQEYEDKSYEAGAQIGYIRAKIEMQQKMFEDFQKEVRDDTKTIGGKVDEVSSSLNNLRVKTGIMFGIGIAILSVVEVLANYLLG